VKSPNLIRELCLDENRVNHTKLTPKEWFSKYWEQSGRKVKTVSKLIGVSTSTVYGALKAFELGGSEGFKHYEIDGHRGNISQLARIYGITAECAFQRIHRGWTVEDAIKTPHYVRRLGPIPGLIEYNGVRDSIAGHARRVGICRHVARKRYLCGWNVKDVFEKPVSRHKKSGKQPLHNCSGPGTITQPQTKGEENV